MIPNDQWSYLELVENLLKNYERIMHLALPNYCYAVIEELHKYTTADFNNYHTSIGIPYQYMIALIQKFLREAPCATIFKRFRTIRRMTQIDLEEDIVVTISEKAVIAKLVEGYFDRLTQYLEETDQTKKENMVQTFKTEMIKQYNEFNLGPSQIETRIIIVTKNVIKNILNDVLKHEESTSFEQWVRLATMDLFINITQEWLSEGRIRKLLEDMKS